MNDDDHFADGLDEPDGRTADASGPLASRRDVLRAAGAGAAATGLGLGSTGSAAATEHLTHTPWLEVEGNKVYDPLGNEVILRGVNIPDPKRLDHTVSARGKNWDHMIDLATNHERGWYANVIRIPVHPGDIAELPPVPEADVDVHMPPTFTQEELVDYCETYLDDVVDYCREQGVYCIVDYHRHWGEGELEWFEPELDEEVRMFWDTVAPRYAEDSHVIFEVYNEPNTPAMYIDDWYTPKYAAIWRRWKQTAQPWVDIIREHAPDNLVVVGSPGWSAMPEGAQIEEFDGGNLMYAYHIYGGHGISSDEGFDGRQTEEGTNSVWEDVPLFMTEFGWEPNQGQWISGTTDGFGSAVSEWADERPIHWTAWCFDITWLPSMWERAFVEDDPDDSVGNPYDGDIPDLCPEPPCEWNLLGRDTGAFEDYAGEYVRQWLEDRSEDDVPQVGNDAQPPTTPGDLSASSVDEQSVDLSWSASSDQGQTELSHYLVTVDGEAWLETEDTSATADNLLAGRAIELGVSAVDTAGNVSDPATAEVTTDDVSADGPPSGPAGLTLSDRTHRSVTLAWDEATASGDADIARYVVYVEGEAVARLSGDETSYRIDDLELDTQYDVAVSAIDRAGNESELVAAVVEPRPATATENDIVVNDFEGENPLTENSLGGWVGGGLASGVEDGVLQVDWDGITYHGTALDTDASDTPYLKVKGRGEGGYEFSMLALKADSADVEVPVGDATDDRIGTEWNVVTLDLEEIGVDLAAPGQLQFDSPWGSAGTFEIDEIWLAGEDDPANGIEGTDGPTSPVSPSDAWTNAVGESSIEMGWESVAAADQYNVYLDGDLEDSTSETTYTIEGLEPDTEYELGVAAENADGESPTQTTTVRTEDGGTEPECETSETLADGSTVCDVDGDGAYMDVTGDGSVTNSDVTEFFGNQHADPWDSRADLFDFTGDDDVTQADVIELFSEIA